MSGEAVLKYLLCYWTGLLPFIHIYHDVCSIPFLTRDYLNMKLLEAKTISWKFYPYLVVCTLANLTMNPMIEHLNKRGIFTNYWVINDDDEIRYLARQTPVQGLMTDRPSTAHRILFQREHSAAEESLKQA